MSRTDTERGTHSVAATVSPEDVVPLKEGAQVLVVDDVALVRKMTSSLLNKHGGCRHHHHGLNSGRHRDCVCVCAGISTRTASNGAECLAALENSQDLPDLILLDREMPVMNGLETCKRIRAMGLAVPVIALTGNALDDVSRRQPHSGTCTSPHQPRHFCAGC